MDWRLKFPLDTVYTVVDWFIPAKIKQDVDLAQRVRMFVISHLFGPFLGHPITISLFLTDPQPLPHVPILGASIFAFWFFPIALKLTGQYHALAIISVQNLTFATLWGCFFYGGVSSPFMPWLLMVPLLAFYYLGNDVRFRIAVIGIITFNLLGFYIAYLLVGEFPVHVPLGEMVGVGMISVFCSAIYVSLMAVYYANVVASESELQREVRRHRLTMAELRGAKEVAEQANSAKSEFLAKMSHELRTPLNAVIGYSEMLLEDAEIEGRGEEIADLEKINRAGRHLLSLVTDVLDLSKIEAGKMDLYIERFDLPAFIKDVEATCRPLVAQNANELVVRQSQELDIVACDMTKLRQAVINLVSNAGKFTKNGKVTLETALEKDPDGDRFSISVRDTGIGIREADMPRLFQNFSQADAGISSQFGGTGLGLALSRRLCRLMGGDITVESEYGKGACFTIHLPVIAADLQAIGAELGGAGGDAIPAERRRPIVLVIDNDQAVLELMDRILDKEGYEVIVTDSAETGIRLARTIRPAAIVLDAMMPDIGEWDLLTTLKGDENLRGCPIIVQSIVDDRKTGFDLGANEYLVKPINRDALVNALSRLCPVGRSGGILVVGGDGALSLETEELLVKENLPVMAVASLDDAVSAARSALPRAVLIAAPVNEGELAAFETALAGAVKPEAMPKVVVLSNGAGEAAANVAEVLDAEGRSPDSIVQHLLATINGTGEASAAAGQEKARA